MEQFYLYSPGSDSLQFEKKTEAIVRSSGSYEELKAEYWECISRHFLPKAPMTVITDEDQLNAVIIHLKNNLKDKHNLSDLSTAFGFSQSKLSKLFRNFKGMSFVEYLTYLRIERAKEFIQSHPSLLINDLAHQVGYDAPLYFSVERPWHSTRS
ncbi:helix-turn-helix transcriptional regulator [Cohnella sp. 56]|uniref:helix-turn-helix transcriptional regulator n=1 Tax=Cohnella sp. 56 TaxID=3113722 RepID=UPI0030EA4DDC